MKHSYIKPGTPQLNGKVERSHSTDRKEFYQLLEYTNDVDLNRKLKDSENFYNYHRPHGAHEGKTPNEKLKSSILNDKISSTPGGVLHAKKFKKNFRLNFFTIELSNEIGVHL